MTLFFACQGRPEQVIAVILVLQSLQLPRSAQCAVLGSPHLARPRPGASGVRPSRPSRASSASLLLLTVTSSADLSLRYLPYIPVCIYSFPLLQLCFLLPPNQPVFASTSDPGNPLDSEVDHCGWCMCWAVLVCTATSVERNIVIAQG